MADPRVLMICHTFPPGSAVGSFRALRFVKYLPENGWQPIVLAMSPQSYLSGKVDPALEEQLPPDLVVMRVPAWRPLRSLFAMLKRLRRHQNEKVKTRHSAEPLTSKGITPGRVRLLLDRVKAVFSTPDTEIAWIIPAALAASKLIWRYKPDVIFCTGPPHSSHLIAQFLGLLTGKPLVLDFRDPWSRCQWGREKSRGLADAINRSLERWCVHSSAALVLNTAELREEFQNEYKSVPANRFHVIMNGYDPIMLLQSRALASECTINSSSNNGEIRICHPGSVYGKRDLRPLIRSAAKASTQRHKIIIEQVGDVAEEEILQQWIKCNKLGAHIRFIGRVDHEQALRHMANADILATIQPGTSIQIPAKLFEMLLFSKPILALSERGATSALVEQYQLGVSVSPDDEEAIVGALVKLRSLTFEAANSSGRQRAMTEFHGGRLTEQLADILTSVSSQ